MRYRQLTLEQRYHIQQCRRSGMSLTAIAKSIGCHKSTISREVKRNTGQRGYRYQQAQRCTAQRHQHKPKVFRLTDEVKQWIVTLLDQALSPEQICGYLKRVKGLSLHHESIYRFIYRDQAEGGRNCVSPVNRTVNVMVPVSADEAGYPTEPALMTDRL